MPYIFGKLWHLAIIWAIRKAFQCIQQGVRILLANHTRIFPTSENDSYIVRGHTGRRLEVSNHLITSPSQPLPTLFTLRNHLFPNRAGTELVILSPCSRTRAAMPQESSHSEESSNWKNKSHFPLLVDQQLYRVDYIRSIISPSSHSREEGSCAGFVRCQSLPG